MQTLKCNSIKSKSICGLQALHHLAWIFDLPLLLFPPCSLSRTTPSSYGSDTPGPLHLLPSLSGIFLQVTEAHSLIYSEFYPHAISSERSSWPLIYNRTHRFCAYLLFLPKMYHHLLLHCFLPPLWYELPEGRNIFYFTHCGVATTKYRDLLNKWMNEILGWLFIGLCIPCAQHRV